MLNLLAPPRAVFSPCQRYRYALWREWADASNRVCWVMLNPSVVDSEKLDPTIRRCIDFSKRWGFGALDVANLFALRSTDPKGLWTVADPVGTDNDRHIVELARRAKMIVCAWGNGGNVVMPGDEPWTRSEIVLALLRKEVPLLEPHCLNLTDLGEPIHPLYRPADETPMPITRPGWGPR